MPTGVLIEMVAVADFVVSATLVALTVAVPAVAGAVYKPVLETVPPPLVTVQVTAVLLLPVTVALNWTEPFVPTDVVAGEIVTATGEVIDILADAALVESATLVAVTMEVPAFAGAVYNPVLETDPLPLVTVQVTRVSVVPLTTAANWTVPLATTEKDAGDMLMDTARTLDWTEPPQPVSETRIAAKDARSSAGLSSR